MMKSFFKKLAFVMALAMVVSMAAPAATTASAASDLKIAYQNGGGYGITELNIAEVGATEDLKFLGAPSNWKELGATWASSNEAVATVDANGVVTAVAAGTADVTLTIGADVAVVKVNVVNVATYTATMGTADDRNITAKTIEEGDTFDFAFYGIKDYDVKRYFCTWASDDTSVATVDQKGLVTAVAPGTAKITLIVFNKVTGQVHNVDACTVTVPSAEPTEAPKPEIVVKQTHENKVTLTFDAPVSLKAEDFVLNCVYEEGMEIDWTIKKVSIKDNVVTIQTYNEFTDGGQYVVRIDGVEEAQFFTASVGDVAKVVPYVASVWSDEEGGYVYPGVVYAASADRAEVDSVIGLDLYDAKGVNVTGHYADLTGDMYIPGVSYDLVTTDSNIMLDATTGAMVAYEAGEAVTILVTYRYYDANGNEIVKEANASFVTQPAPAYTITEVREWTITKVGADAGSIDWSKPVHEIAVEDDNDDEDSSCDYELVLLLKDNYGTTYATKDSGVQSWNHYYALDDGARRFCLENYSIEFETSNTNKMIISADGVFTTYAAGTIPVIVSLHNYYDEYNNTFVKNLMAVPVKVLEERKVSNMVVNGATILTDSYYEWGKWDFASGNIWIGLYDQYWTAWGDNRNLKVTANVDGVADYIVAAAGGANGYVTTVGSKNSSNPGLYIGNLFGADLKALMGTKTSVTVTVLDEATGTKQTCRIVLKSPIYNADGTIKTVARRSLTAEDVDVKNWDIVTNSWDRKYVSNIKFTEVSNNSPVKYQENVTFAASQGALNAAVEGVAKIDDRYIVVYNPDGNIVGLASDAANKGIGMEVSESGKYAFIAAAKQDSGIVQYAKVGTYTIKVLKIRDFYSNGAPMWGEEYKTTFKVTNTLDQVTVKEQKKIESSKTTIEDIVMDAFKFNVVDDKTNIAEDGVVYRYNAQSGYVIITKVTFEVPIYNWDKTIKGYYTSTVNVNRSIKVPNYSE